MKTVISFILIIVISLHAVAQISDTARKYIWKNTTTNVSAAIEFFGSQQKNTSACIFYLDAVDTVYNNKSDSLFNLFINAAALNCPVIKISFYNPNKEFGGTKCKIFADEFSKFIVPDFQKKYPLLKKNNYVVSGVDFFSAVAFLTTSTGPLFINKTALFFTEEIQPISVNNVFKTNIKNIKGKIFLYANQQNTKIFFADSLANNMALNSSLVIYKFDQYSSLYSIKIFEEAYNWLMATGNNYIILPDD